VFVFFKFTQFTQFKYLSIESDVCWSFSSNISYLAGGLGSSIGIAIELPGWTVLDRVPVGTTFSAHPDRPCGPPSLL